MFSEPPGASAAASSTSLCAASPRRAAAPSSICTRPRSASPSSRWQASPRCNSTRIAPCPRCRKTSAPASATSASEPRFSPTSNCAASACSPIIPAASPPSKASTSRSPNTSVPCALNNRLREPNSYLKKPRHILQRRLRLSHLLAIPYCFFTPNPSRHLRRLRHAQNPKHRRRNILQCAIRTQRETRSPLRQRR